MLIAGPLGTVLVQAKASHSLPVPGLELPGGSYVTCGWLLPVPGLEAPRGTGLEHRLAATDLGVL